MEDSDDYGDSDSEDEQVQRRRKPSNAAAAAAPVSNIPGLTPKQVKKLMQLSSVNATVDKDISNLKQQLQELVQAAQTKNPPASPDVSATPKREIRDLQKKLHELEQRTSVALKASASQIYTPLLVKDDMVFKKYFKLQQLEMAEDQIKQKMHDDGIDPDYLNKPDQISPNDPGPANGAYVPLTIREDPKFKKYFKLLRMNMPIEQIKMKMEVDRVDPELLHRPHAVSPNDPGPKLAAIPPPSPTLMMPLVSQQKDIEKYKKLEAMGMPKENIQAKMKLDGVDPNLLDQPLQVAAAGGISVQDLYAMLLKQQAMFESGAFKKQQSGQGQEKKRASISIEDQMAAELAAADDAIDDIFGTEEPVAVSGGLTMVQQLEKKARRDENKKLIANKDQLNELIQKLLNENFESENEAIVFSKKIADQLESFGLSLGTDENQTWSARLLIKNKTTRDWYFSESQRFDAGKAYGRLWSLTTLAQYVDQLIAKEIQTRNAPETLKGRCKSKTDMMDQYTELLKEAVKTKHKIFQSQFYTKQVQKIEQWKIPHELDQHRGALIDSGSVLAVSSLNMADEEFVLLEKSTRGKKIRAQSAIHVAERAIQLVGIIKKIGSQNLPMDRVLKLQQQVDEVRQAFIRETTTTEEDDDDVL